jgi:hypothetical protein
MREAGDINMIKRQAQLIAFGGALWIGSVGTAHAYLDPGTGSFFLQVLIGGIVGSLAAIKLYWTRIKLFFSSHKRASTNSD